MISFAAFYEAIHNRPPFQWQEHVASQIAETGWPENDVLDPPTAAGKTSLIDIAVYALALQSGRSASERTAPLRSFFVIDRRLVVDDITRHALQVMHAIEDNTALREVRERLCAFGGDRPLEVATLRGGMYRDDSWLNMPNQPLVCVSTVDQVGSRLLFRGYGVSDRRRPIDAGLIGCDSLIILDEAHLSQPFVETLRWVRKYAGWAEQPPAPAPHVIEMTATSKRQSGFELTSAIYENDPELSPRLLIAKNAVLRETSDIVADASAEARSMMSPPNVKVVGVIVNRVDTARRIFQKLSRGDDSAVLLTGRIRPWDRDQLLEKFRDRMKAGRSRGQEPLFVVATQTVEVGADLDFDALITEAAPLDALRQRFGRLNRLGQLETISALLLKRKRKKGEKDSVYGEPLDSTWEWLNEHASREDNRVSIDFGALRMKALFSQFGNECLNSGTKDGPVMLPAYVDAWVQTCPAPSPDSDVAPFLHGAEHASTDVNIVWRADLPDSFDDWPDVIEAAPPMNTEALPVPIWAAKKWLAKEPAGGVSDVNSGSENGDVKDQSQRLYWAWRGPGIRAGREPRPGDTIVVRSAEGGADPYGWFPECTDSVSDIGDLCANKRAGQGGGRFRVRFHPRLYFGEDAERVNDLLNALSEGDTEARNDLREMADRVHSGANWRFESYGPEKAVIAVSRWFHAKPKGAAPAAEDSNEDSDSLTVDVSLREHTDDVVDRAQRFAAGCGLSAELSEAIRRAAELHDLGKWDNRFQIMLAPGRDPDGEPLAKGQGRASQAERRRRREFAQYPRDARHEFWSVALAEDGELLRNDALADLIAYLIGTHHGYGRPLAPYWKDDESVTAMVDGKLINCTNAARFASFGSGWVDSFVALNRRYGLWGLAYLEAILRRADCVASKEEEQRHERD